MWHSSSFTQNNQQNTIWYIKIIVRKWLRNMLSADMKCSKMLNNIALEMCKSMLTWLFVTPFVQTITNVTSFSSVATEGFHSYIWHLMGQYFRTKIPSTNNPPCKGEKADLSLSVLAGGPQRWTLFWSYHQSQPACNPHIQPTQPKDPRV